MNLNSILREKGIDPHHVLVLRHCFPKDPQFSKVVPWLAAEKPKLFNAIQHVQTGKKAERAVSRAKYVAAFIGHEAGKAIFIGLYSVRGSKPISRKQYLSMPIMIQLFKYASWEPSEARLRPSFLLFDLILMTGFYPEWKGKLIVNWPPPERSWFRWGDRNVIPIDAILEDSALDAPMEEWDEIDFTWAQLGVLPMRLKSKLCEWRGIYYIFDTSKHKGYVGSAYGEDNLLGRWQNYAARGHGGNHLLRKLDHRNFQFTILQRVSPDMDAGDVVKLEISWKRRLHTQHPLGLNAN